MKKIDFGRPIIGQEEKNIVMDVLNGPILVHGERTKTFEKKFAEYTGAPHAVSLSSCTAGMHLAYFNLGITSGDEVIVPAQTHVATAHAVELCGAKPVFVDAEISTGNIDVNRIEEKIKERTKAISVVHYLGMPVNMRKVVEVAKKYNLFVLEDCALAIGTYFNGIHAGLHGDAGCYSFYPVKHITTAEGGMLITKHEDVAKAAALNKAFGVDRHVGERKVPGEYDVISLGFNYRMNEIQAALGIVQLDRINGFLEKRKENYETLTSCLQEIDELDLFTSSHDEYQSSYYCLSILLEEKLVSKRLDIINALKARNIGTSIYYPEAVPLLSYYKNKYGHEAKSFPVANRISKGSIALPVGPHLTPNDMKSIAGAVKNIIKVVK